LVARAAQVLDHAMGGRDLKPPHPAYMLAEEPNLMQDLNHRHVRCD
jgi:hypothetical protein